ncbi:MAG: hypothetical protein IJY17_05110 [Alphaproteobacteria bacterium]|nr:hypothetical protein [Alphaproteobacteria bacterium]
MELYQIDIKPSGGFYTPIKGDTLFGIFCWAVVDRFGEQRLTELLEGYTENKPFIVISDAFPQGFLPKPVLPFPYYKKAEDGSEPDAKKRKEFKRREWLPADKISLPTNRMADLFAEVPFMEKSLKTTNSVNPETNHAGGGKYSAYKTEMISYHGFLTVYAVIDETRISSADVETLFRQIGQSGYGKKASSGGGKFSVESVKPVSLSSSAETTALMTLAPCVPVSDEFDADKSFYKVFVRFGRHGNRAALSENPFKNPVMTMDTGAVLTPKTEKTPLFVGTGVTGVSLSDPRTVFQGYAPVVALNAKETE